MKKTPTGLELTPFNPDYQEDPYPILRQLRENDPLHHDEELKRYFPTRYDDVRAMLRDPHYLTDPHNSLPDSYARHFLTEEGQEVSMLLADEPRHLRLRRLVNDLFKPRAVERCICLISLSEASTPRSRNSRKTHLPRNPAPPETRIR